MLSFIVGDFIKQVFPWNICFNKNCLVEHYHLYRVHMYLNHVHCINYGKTTNTVHILNKENFLSAVNDSSLVNGRSNHLFLVNVSWITLPKISTKDGAFSTDWQPIWILTPTMTTRGLVLVISILKPFGCK